MPMLISTQRLLKSPPSKGQFRGRTYTDALSGSNLGWIGTVERFEISKVAGLRLEDSGIL